MWPLSRVLKRSLRKHSTTAPASFSIPQPASSKPEIPAEPREADCLSEQKWGVGFPEQSKCDHFVFHIEMPQCPGSSCWNEVDEETVNSCSVLQWVSTPTRWSFWLQWKIPEIEQEWEVCEWLRRSLSAGLQKVDFSLKEWMETEAYQPYWILSLQLPSIVLPQMGSWEFLMQESSWGWAVNPNKNV